MEGRKGRGRNRDKEWTNQKEFDGFHDSLDCFFISNNSINNSIQ